MKLYLAARYSEKAQIKKYSKELESLGHIVTSRWLDERLKATAELDDITPKFCRIHAVNDLTDINLAEALVLFSVDPNIPTKRGGRHVEFGYALALEKQIYIIGPYENIFHYLPNIKQFNTWEEFLEELKNA